MSDQLSYKELEEKNECLETMELTARTPLILARDEIVRLRLELAEARGVIEFYGSLNPENRAFGYESKYETDEEDNDCENYSVCGFDDLTFDKHNEQLDGLGGKRAREFLNKGKI